LGSITSTIKGILQQIHSKIKVVFRPTHHMNIILNNKMMRQQNMPVGWSQIRVKMNGLMKYMNVICE
jgi:hypothetical protein